MRNVEERRLQRVVAVFCALLFALFSFSFVAVYQAPLLEVFYDEVATGKLEFNAYLVGGLASLTLTLIALWLNRLAKFRREWTAMAYLPSALLLAFVTDIDRSLYTGGSFSLMWVIIFAVGIIIYCFVAFVLRKMLFVKIKNATMAMNRVLWRNIVLFILMFCLVGTLSNGEENFKREALMMSHYNNGDIDKALRVGYTSPVASRELTAMRAYILAGDNSLGEHLFEYPQHYGPDGLLPALERTSPLVPDSVYALLGATPLEGESTVDFLSRIAHSDSVANVVKDYYLSSLLLDKRLIKFKDEALSFYGENSVDSLPKHYREALMLYADVADSTDVLPYKVSDDGMSAKLDEFRALEAQYEDPFIRGNYVRDRFGRTYWCYFLYSN